MRELVRSTLPVFLALTIVTGLVYPLAVTAAAQILFPSAANGSFVIAGGKVVGSRLIGQFFGDPKHLWGRPSATAPTAYNAAASSGSNLGPNNPALTTAVAARIEALRAVDPGNTTPVPVDLITASGSGLDPHISPAAAAYQVSRIARVRGLDDENVRRAIASCAEGRQYGVLGEPRVNVLCVNQRLDNAGLTLD